MAASTLGSFVAWSQAAPHYINFETLACAMSITGPHSKDVINTDVVIVDIPLLETDTVKLYGATEAANGKTYRRDCVLMLLAANIPA